LCRKDLTNQTPSLSNQESSVPSLVGP
jgi:hypothetical protein